jgi:hypothetical protein
MTALTPRFAATADNPFLGMFGIEEPPADPDTLSSYSVEGHRSIASQLKRSDIELSAVSPAVVDGVKGYTGWSIACVSPAFPSPGYWHIAVVHTAGYLDHTILPVAGSRVGVHLKHFGVNTAVFESRPGSPAAHNPWGPDGDKPAPKPRTVYFIQPVGGGLIKIGIASNVASRLSGLQTGSPVELHVIAVIRGVEQSTEAELHLRFAAARRHGEWFEPTPELLAYIAEHAEVPR